MAIVTLEYYNETYIGETIAEADFPRAEARAERIIAQITHGRATAETFAALPAFQQAAVKEAICAQIEYYALYGVEVSISGKTADGWTVGKVRVDGGSSAAARTGAPTMVSPSAIAALEQTGLLNPHVATVGDPPQVPYPWGVI
jgi:hypothetical protein